MKRALGLLALLLPLLTGCDLLSSKPQGAEVLVQTAPTGSTVRCDGVDRGVSPVTISSLPPGTHLLAIQREGYREDRRAISVMEGQRLSLNIELDELKGLALIQSSPTGAEIYVDQTFRGRTPLLMPDLPLGTYRIQLSLSGYFSKALEMKIADRIPLQIKVDLLADSANLRFASQPSGATVLIGGAARGKTPCVIEGVPSGEVALELRLDGFETYSEKLAVKAGEEYTINAPLRSLPGSLQVVSQPEGARIYVDNSFRGPAPVNLKDLPAGEHRIRAELRGYETQARTVTLRAGAALVEEFRMAGNSGVLLLVTEPPDVRVLIDGEEVGTTKPSAAGIVSDALKVDLISQGEHTLQLARSGYAHPGRKFTMEVGQAVNLHEKMTRLFIPDIEVRLRESPQTYRTGVLIREYPNGDLEVEVRPGVIESMPGDQILSRRVIKASAP